MTSANLALIFCLVVMCICIIKATIWMQIYNHTSHPLGKAYAGGRVTKYVIYILAIWLNGWVFWYLLSRNEL